MARHPFAILTVAGAASLMAHGLAYASLAFAPKPAPEPPPSHVAIRVRAPAPPPPAPPPKPLEPPAPEPPRAARAKAQSTGNPQPTVAPPAAVDLTGVTLTNDSGGGAWASAVGNGSALNGPVGPIGVGPKAKPSAAAPVVTSRAPEIPLVELADLSTKPVPPELAGNLRELYPVAAKQRAIGGSASVEARIEPDGRVRRVTLKNETFAGFGDACRQALLGSRWSPPRDRDGHQVATLVRYTCRFVVQP
jgi:hypothetical protein